MRRFLLLASLALLAACSRHPTLTPVEQGNPRRRPPPGQRHRTARTRPRDHRRHPRVQRRPRPLRAARQLRRQGSPPRPRGGPGVGSLARRARLHLPPASRGKMEQRRAPDRGGFRPQLPAHARPEACRGVFVLPMGAQERAEIQRGQADRLRRGGRPRARRPHAAPGTGAARAVLPQPHRRAHVVSRLPARHRENRRGRRPRQPALDPARVLCG